jgi:hypothetical protein
MSIFINPQTAALTPSLNSTTSPYVLVNVPTGGLNTHQITFNTSAIQGTGSVIPTATAVNDQQALIYFVTTDDAFGTFTCIVTDPNSSTTANLVLTVAPSGLLPFAQNVPTGYNATTLVAMIRLRANEPTLPSTTQILTLANAGIEQVERALGAIRLVGTYPTVPNQTVQALTNDVQDILSCSWSTGPVTAPGTLVYPMFQYDQGTFMDLAAGFPAVGFGPPVYFWVYRDQSGTMEMQLYPAAMLGQLNVYYRARPTIWNTSAGTNTSTTNLDTSMQEAVILWTVARVLEARGRGGEAAQIWTPQFKEIMEELREDTKRRTQQKSGTVRDVRSRGFPAGPWGWI